MTNLERIIQEHLIKGQVVTELAIAKGPLPQPEVATTGLEPAPAKEPATP